MWNKWFNFHKLGYKTRHQNQNIRKNEYQNFSFSTLCRKMTVIWLFWERFPQIPELSQNRQKINIPQTRWRNWEKILRENVQNLVKISSESMKFMPKNWDMAAALWAIQENWDSVGANIFDGGFSSFEKKLRSPYYSKKGLFTTCGRLRQWIERKRKLKKLRKNPIKTGNLFDSVKNYDVLRKKIINWFYPGAEREKKPQQKRLNFQQLTKKYSKGKVHLDIKKFLKLIFLFLNLASPAVRENSRHSKQQREKPQMILDTKWTMKAEESASFSVRWILTIIGKL